MNTTSRQMIAAIAVALLLTAVPLASTFAGDQAVSAVGAHQTGNAVHVTLNNPSKSAQTVTVTVEANVGGEVVHASSSVRVSGGESATVSLHFSQPLEGFTVGISDGANPI